MTRIIPYKLLICLICLAIPCSAQSSEPAKSKTLVAVVAGQPVYENELLPLIQPQLLQLRNQEFELKSKALDNLVQQKLFEAEAKAKGVSVEKLIEQEIDLKLGEPTAGEIEAYYLGLKDRISRPFEEIKPQLVESLKQAKSQQAKLDYLKKLREKSEVVVLLSPARTKVDFDPTRLLGRPDAPVMIVEFSEFQCPFCQKVQPTIKNLLAKYPGQVSLSFRDFPLRQIHPQAQGAAEAARCAGEQGKFWEFHDRLFANAAKLDSAALLEHARNLSLDEAKFSQCLSSGKFKPKIEEDLQEMLGAGINGAPAFFINGIFVSGAQNPQVFEKIIESELAAKRFQK